MRALSETDAALARPWPDAARDGVLVIQLARLGDFLQTTPLLHVLKQKYPEYPLTALVTPAQAPLAHGCRAVDRVVELEAGALLSLLAQGDLPAGERRAEWQRLTRPLEGLDPQEIYNLNLGPLGASLTAQWPGAQKHAWRISADGKGVTGEPWAGFVMNLVSDRRLTRLHLTDILASYGDPQGPVIDGLDYQLTDEHLRLAQELLPEKRPVAVLQLGANSPLRRWPVEFFADLAQGLIQNGAWPVLTGGSNEAPLGRRLKRILGPLSRRVTDLMGKTDLPTLGGVLASAQLVASGDTGTLHLATAVGAPVLALFMGPAVVHETGPYGAGHLVLQARDMCGPCQEQNPACAGKAPCRRLITPQAALKAAMGILAGDDPAKLGADLNLNPGVDALVGVLDGFGQRYRPLRPRPIGLAEGLALALREAGRALLRSSYETRRAEMAAELRSEHLPPEPKDKAGLEGLAQAAFELAAASSQGDPGRAERIIGRAPGLRFLQALAGAGQPPRLAEACLTAARVLTAASAL